MKQVDLTDFETYFEGALDTLPNLTSIGTLTSLGVDNIYINGSTITSANANGNILLTPNGTGDVWICGGYNSSGVTITDQGAISAKSTLTVDGRILCNHTNNATAVDGAGAAAASIQTAGGLAVVKSAVIGDNLSLLSDSSVLSLGAGSDATLTHDGTTGLTIAANPISIDSADKLDLSSTSGDINFQAGGTNKLSFNLDGLNQDIIMKLKVNGDDFVFKTHAGIEVFRVEDNGDFDICGGSGSTGVTITGSTGALSASGDITSNASDRRLKKDIRIIENPLDKLKKLTGFTFNWDKEKCEETGFNPKYEIKEVGVFAQDIQEVLPEAVRPAPFDTDLDGNSKSGDNYLTVQYEKIVALLIESNKALLERVEELEKIVKK